MRRDTARSRFLGLLLAAAGGLPAGALAQEPALDRGLPPLLPRDREISLARSAAPPEVSGDATVLVLERGGYAVAEQGTNGVTCYVSRSRVISIEPHCFDREGTESILAIHVREAELREQGLGKEAIDARIAREIQEGTLRLPRRPAMSYMMSSAQELYNDAGDPVGAWRPHLMIYYPFLRASDLGLGEPNSFKAAMVSPDGGSESSIVIIVPEFIDPVFDTASDGA